MKRLLFAISAMIFSVMVFASPISDAVSAGKAKELPSGYVQAIDNSSSMQKLVKKVNTGRRAQYEKIAKKNNISVAAVGRASYGKRFPN